MAQAMRKELSDNLDTFRASVAAEADHIIYHTFPTKILELQKRIEDIDTPSSIYNLLRTDAMTDTAVYNPDFDLNQVDAKKRKRGLDGEAVNGYNVDADAGSGALYTGHVKTGADLQAIHAELKAEWEELGRSCEKVNLWIALTMPKIEDGDNFGVGVQEEVVGELQRAQESVSNMRNIGRQYHISRAKICAKLLKYPHIEDHVFALREHDESQIHYARGILFDLRTMYALLTHIIHQNITKIRFPKGNNAASLY